MSLPDAIESLLQQVETEYPGALVTGWVIAYELVDPADGQKLLRFRESPQMTPWLRDGILRTVLDEEWAWAEDDDDA